MDASANIDTQFSWYSVVPASSPLEQGDFLNSFPVPTPPSEIAEIPDEPVGHEINAPYTVDRFNVVIMTQSCDLPKLREEDEVILCPRFSYPELIDEIPKYGGKDGWKTLISGRFIGAHILNKCDIEGIDFEYQVIDLQRIFSIPLAIVTQVAHSHDARIRLLPPYREHLAQAFARQFMRVGLPIDLPRDYPYH
jgi:hypothetical protein